MPNSISPGAEPLANMCPAILMENGRPLLAIGAARGRTIFPTMAQLLSYVIDYGMSLERAFLALRIDASSPVIQVNREAPADIAARIAAAFPIEIIADTLYPVHFAVPSAVLRDPASGLNSGMAHQTHPWAGVAEMRAVRGRPMERNTPSVERGLFLAHRKRRREGGQA